MQKQRKITLTLIGSAITTIYYGFGMGILLWIGFRNESSLNQSFIALGTLTVWVFYVILIFTYYIGSSEQKNTRIIKGLGDLFLVVITTFFIKQAWEPSPAIAATHSIGSALLGAIRLAAVVSYGSIIDYYFYPNT